MSSAIRITAPSSPASGPATLTVPSSDASILPNRGATAKLCRNTLIYGYCKHENDGCLFYHPPSTPQPPTHPQSSPNSPTLAHAEPNRTLPSTALSLLAAKNVSAFVPKTASSAATVIKAPNSEEKETSSPALKASTPAFHMSPKKSQAVPSLIGQNNSTPDMGLGEVYSQLSLNAPPFDPPFGSRAPDFSTLQQPIQMDDGLVPSLAGALYEDQFYQHPVVRQPLDYNLYTTPLPYIHSLHHPSSLNQTPTAQDANLHTFFLSPTLSKDLHQRSAAIMESSPIPIPGLPETLHVYHSLHPLEPGTVGVPVPGTLPGESSAKKANGVLGLGSEVYKAVSERDGKVYCLRRIEGFKIMHDKAFGPVESWRRVHHPAIVSVQEAFTTRAFGDNSVIFVSNYHPAARTLYSEHFVPRPPTVGRNGRLQPQDMHIPERTLWSYIIQIVGALRAVHREGLACRLIESSKILVTGKNRIRINCCGILDVIAYDGGQNMAQHQQEDLISLGKLILSLTNLSTSATQNLPKALDILSRSYSSDIQNLVMYLLGNPGQNGKTVEELSGLIEGRVWTEMEAAEDYNDLLEGDMTRELENGRLVRLLCKFGFINERPEFDHDPRWSESGDRYIIKLFRDMVFHQVDEFNKPVLDLSHVLTCLNKLDAGSDEKVMLMSRDEQSCLVVSYREIKECIEAAFNDLSRGSI
ncbi:Poly(A) ribonuclease subunit [Phaffia rhodozyma]|uniref:PAN2-PAN3 deadenylation complex subunit PAN3 n=1 Tax=Phaffia rhodozyma TaxID=264483 RepID=A0A0F7SYP4_PHARH|nr:Poly(A) ribonuclease subunit [Phaffia rhodozyma]